MVNNIEDIMNDAQNNTMMIPRRMKSQQQTWRKHPTVRESGLTIDTEFGLNPETGTSRLSNEFF